MFSVGAIAPTLLMELYTDSGRKKLGELVKAARRRRDGSMIPYRAFAAQLDCAYSTLLGMENGTIQEPPIAALYSLAPVLGLTLLEVIGVLMDRPLNAPEQPRFARDLISYLEDLPGLELLELQKIIDGRLRYRAAMNERLQ